MEYVNLGSSGFKVSRFVTMQNHYNLLYREEEREMIPLCREEGIGIIPWSPLARGLLAEIDRLLSPSSSFGLFVVLTLWNLFGSGKR